MSWTLAKGGGFLSGISLAKLKGLYRIEKKAKPKQRLLCAIHRKEGKSIDAIKDIMHIPKRTVHECLRRFEKRGVSAKDSIKQSGRPIRLTKQQRKELVSDLEKGPNYNKSGLWSTKDVRELLQKKYMVSFVPQHVYRMLISLGFSIQRPRKKHYKSASEEEIMQFKKKQTGYPDNTGKWALSWAYRMRQHSA